MQEVVAAVTIRRAHNLAGNGSFQLRPRHLERPKSFHFSATGASAANISLRQRTRVNKKGEKTILLFKLILFLRFLIIKQRNRDKLLLHRAFMKFHVADFECETVRFPHSKIFSIALYVPVRVCSTVKQRQEPDFQKCCEILWGGKK